MRTSLRPLLVAIAAAAVALSCGDSPTGPGSGAQLIPMGAVVVDTVTGADTVRYLVRVRERQSFSVFVRPVAGRVAVAVWDSAYVNRIGFIVVNAANGDGDWPLGRLATAATLFTKSQLVHIVVTGEGRYQLEPFAASLGPEHVSATVAVGDTIVGENLEAWSDVDTYTFHGTKGDELVAYVEGTGPSSAEGLTLAVDLGASGTALAVSSGSDPELETQMTGRFVLPADGDYTVTIRNPSYATGYGYVGPYRFMLRRVDRRPEHVAVAAAVGDTTLGESIDYAGDIDEFTITGTPGSEYNVLFRAVGAPPRSIMTLVVPDAQPTSGAATPPTILSTGSDSVLTDRATGRFALPASGHATVRVSADGAVRGAYQIYVYPVNRTPESAAATLALDDSVLTERIDMPGDVDEFRVSLAAATKVSILLEIDADSPFARTGVPQIGAQLVSRATGEVVTYTDNHYPQPPTSVAAVGATVPAGDYVLRVESTAPQVNGFYGHYRLYLYALHDTPEGASPSLAVGDVVSERIDPIGDRDIYTFDGVRGDDIDVLFLDAGPGSPGLMLSVWAPDGTGLGEAYAAALSSDLRHTGRLTLPATGTYRVWVASVNVAEQGPYRLTMTRVGRSPETHGATVAPGDVVTDESLDSLGDVDEFTLRAAPGSEVVVFFTALTNPTNSGQVEILDSRTRAVISTQASFGFEQSSGRLTMPASGELIVRVTEQRFGVAPGYRSTGPYRLEVVQVDRAPEVVSPAIAVDQTVAGEAISPEGDVDEFQFSGTAGQRVAVYFQAPNGTSWYEGLTLELLAPGADQPLASAVVVNPTSRLEDVSTADVTLPSDGRYVVRVRGTNDRYGTGNYVFMVHALP